MILTLPAFVWGACKSSFLSRVERPPCLLKKREGADVRNRSKLTPHLKRIWRN